MDWESVFLHGWVVALYTYFLIWFLTRSLLKLFIQ